MSTEQAQSKSMLRWLWLAVVVIVLDQVTKMIIVEQFVLGERLPVMPTFNLVLAHNYGAAFSFLAQAGGWQRWFFTAIAVTVSIVLIVWIKRLATHERWLAIALALILGGAIGNLYDRITLGYVVDFLDFYWGTSHFPAFNVADMAISVGAFMVILETLGLIPASWRSDANGRMNGQQS